MYAAYVKYHSSAADLLKRRIFLFSFQKSRIGLRPDCCDSCLAQLNRGCNNNTHLQTHILYRCICISVCLSKHAFVHRYCTKEHNPMSTQTQQSEQTPWFTLSSHPTHTQQTQTHTHTHTLRRNYFELGVRRRECSWEQQGHKALWEVRWGPAFPLSTVCLCSDVLMADRGQLGGWGVLYVRSGLAIRLSLLRVALCHCRKLWCSSYALSVSRLGLPADSSSFGNVMIWDLLLFNFLF